MKKRLILMVGKGGAGKDWVCRKIGWRKVKKYTTRSPRFGEWEYSDEYMFTVEDAVDRIAPRHERIAETSFGGYTYFTLMDLLREGEVYIVDPDGVQWMRTASTTLLGDEFSLVVVEVASSLFNRIVRMVNRDKGRLGIVGSFLAALKRVRIDAREFKKLRNVPRITILN